MCSVYVRFLREEWDLYLKTILLWRWWKECPWSKALTGTCASKFICVSVRWPYDCDIYMDLIESVVVRCMDGMRGLALPNTHAKDMWGWNSENCATLPSLCCQIDHDTRNDTDVCTTSLIAFSVCSEVQASGFSTDHQLAFEKVICSFSRLGMSMDGQLPLKRK